MISFPPCKINLGLHIVSKRPDGYHELETCFYPVSWTDILEILPAENTSFISSGHPIPGNPQDNLCLKAYHLLATAYNLSPVRIHLHKVIPMGAGLGGGSSDGAHTLRLLNTLFELNLSPETLMVYAAKLGSDCAFFTQDQPMLGRGRGEILTPIDVNLKGKYIAMVKPDIHVSTAEAYAHITPSLPRCILTDVLQQPINQWKDLLENDFEASVFRRYPSIEKIKQDLYAHGAVYASMSGSGATVFGIFDNPVDTAPFAAHMVWTGAC